MPLTHIILHGVLYAFIGTFYLFILMISLNPRVWGYQDYPEVIKKKVSPQTKKERLLAGIVTLPWFVFIICFPILSTYILKNQLGGEIPFELAFLNIFFLVFLIFICDLVILDWFLISKITPNFVIIPGTEASDYKDFSHHYKAHAKASILLILFCFLIAAFIVFI